jgi:hypothetical protein
MKMTKEELEVIDYLRKAWGAFLKLERQHPDEERDFADGIHKCQYLMGMRVARRVDPLLFPVKVKEECGNCYKWMKTSMCSLEKAGRKPSCSYPGCSEFITKEEYYKLKGLK